MLTASDKRRLQKRLSERTNSSGKKLTPDQREALVAEFLSDETMTIAAIARKYGIKPPSAAYLLRSRAR